MTFTERTAHAGFRAAQGAGVTEALKEEGRRLGGPRLCPAWKQGPQQGVGRMRHRQMTLQKEQLAGTKSSRSFASGFPLLPLLGTHTHTHTHTHTYAPHSHTSTHLLHTLHTLTHSFSYTHTTHTHRPSHTYTLHTHHTPYTTHSFPSSCLPNTS